MDNLKKWSSRIIWTGIIVNMLFVFPLFFAPEFILNIFHLKLDRVIWAQAAGMLLFIISIYYIPAALDIDRYRANAWYHCIPSRACGSTFFAINVLFLGAEPGFLSIAIVDAIFGLLILIILLRITNLEKQQGTPVKLFS